MPFSEELGMRVYDPREGQQYGINLAQLANQTRRTALDERQIQMQEEQVALKAKQQFRRQMGMQAWQEEAQRLVNEGGLDPQNAQKQAFFKYFPMMTEGLDSAPQLLERFTQADAEAQRKREHDSLLFELRQQQALNAADTLDLRRSLGQERENRLREKSDWERMDKEQQRRLQEAQETGRNARAEAALKLKEMDQELKRQKALASDLDLQRIDANLKDAQDLLAKKKSSPWLHPWTNAAGLEASIKDLEKQRRDRLNELGVGTTTEPSKPRTPRAEVREGEPKQEGEPAGLQLIVGHQYKDAQGTIRTYKGKDTSGKDIWE